MVIVVPSVASSAGFQLVAQHALEHLARGIAGQRLAQHHLPRQVERPLDLRRGDVLAAADRQLDLRQQPAGP
jgi:hypothetical protein